jgi:ADP-heptose:LPS heptosyltransferase/GT2 family glycosyltransferase
MSPEPSGPRTLVLAFDTYGDLVLRQPLLTRLVDEGHRLTVALCRSYRGILPFLEPRAQVVTTEINPYLPGDEGFWPRVDELRRAVLATDPEIVVSAPFNRTLLDETLLPSFPAARRYGFANPNAAPETGAGPLLTHVVEVAEESREVEKNQALYEAVSARAEPLPPPRILLSEEIRRQASRILHAHSLTPGGFVLGCPAGTTVTALKAWPRADYLEVMRHLHERHGLTVLLAGVAAEEPCLRAIASPAEAGGMRAPVWIGTPETLGTFLGLIAASRLYVGSDSGPMHFAAALDVPVVARFGGGHWPRFLPAARRGLIATQRLPCFGCNWDCWLEEPACIHSAPGQAIREGIDRLLSEDSGSLRVETGQPVDGLAGKLIDEGSLRHRRMAAELRSVRSSLESELRSTRSSLEASQLLLEASERDRAARLAQIQQLAWQLRAQEATIQFLERARDQLHKQTAYLSTPAGAVRVLTETGLRGVGIFEAARRHRALLQRLIPVPPPPSAQAPEGVSSTEASDDWNPSIVDAFVLARSLGGDTHELALERLYHLGARLRDVVCLPGPARSAQAACMLAAGGARVTVLGTTGALATVAIPGLTAAGQGVGDWLVSRGGVLGGVDGVLLDVETPEEDERLLRGRLSADCLLLVNGPHQRPGLHGAPATEPEDGLTVVSPAPPTWRDPAGADPEYYGQKPWVPGPRRGIALPAALPSGRPWPRISVVTVTLNQAEYLEETLRSVLGQDYPDLEYIVVDGGSTDDTPRILAQYRDRLAHFLSGPDDGQADALNKGFALATGDILAWLNSDDRYPAGALWRAALAFDAYGADMVVGGCALVKGDEAQSHAVHHPALPLGRVVALPLGRLLDVEGSWTKGDFFYQPEVFWTREIWQGVGGRVAKDLYYSMDYELWLRMAGSGARIVHVPDTLAVYRMHERQKTNGAQPPYLPELRQVASRFRAARATGS